MVCDHRLQGARAHTGDYRRDCVPRFFAAAMERPARGGALPHSSAIEPFLARPWCEAPATFATSLRSIRPAPAHRRGRRQDRQESVRSARAAGALGRREAARPDRRARAHPDRCSGPAPAVAQPWDQSTSRTSPQASTASPHSCPRMGGHQTGRTRCPRHLSTVSRDITRCPRQCAGSGHPGAMSQDILE